MENTLINRLKIELNSNNLPGIEAQLKMGPVDRKYLIPGESYKNAGILILLYFKNNELYTVLIKRNKYPGPHSGQISFPGGQQEESDKDLIDTAIRETEEEIGVDLSEIQILGTLTSLFIYVSKFKVLPVIGIIEKVPKFLPDIKEVERAIEVKISDFLNEENKNYLYFSRLGEKIKAPCYMIDNNQIWGATAMIISELSEILRNINFPQ